MNKILGYSSRLHRVFDSVPMKEHKSIIDVNEPNQALLDLIFQSDPVTGLPVGDLSVFMGEKTNPEVKMFIESQLLHERIDSESAMNLPTDVTNKFRELSDDDVALFSRNHNESREDYARRLQLYFANERLERVKKAKEREYNALVEKLKNGN